MIIFWIKSNIFSDCFVVFGSRTKISVISDFWTNHFGNVVKRPSRVHRKRSGKNVFFSEEVIFCLPFSLNGNLWVCEQKLLHGCQISILIARRILWRKSHFRETVSFWSISVNKCSEGMNNLHPQVQKKNSRRNYDFLKLHHFLKLSEITRWNFGLLVRIFGKVIKTAFSSLQEEFAEKSLLRGNLVF